MTPANIQVKVIFSYHFSKVLLYLEVEKIAFLHKSKVNKYQAFARTNNIYKYYKI